jgi:drug/metabolite transporter (DMT)-like permease
VSLKTRPIHVNKDLVLALIPSRPLKVDHERPCHCPRTDFRAVPCPAELVHQSIRRQADIPLALLHLRFALLFSAVFYFLYRVGIPQPVAHAWCFGSGFIHFIYWPFLTQSYKEGDLSHVSFTIERVSYIVGLRQISIVFAVLMGSHFLKEKHRGIRLTGSLIIFTGGFLIWLAK